MAIFNYPLNQKTCAAIRENGAEHLSKFFEQIHEEEDHKVLSIFRDVAEALSNKKLPQLQTSNEINKFDVSQLLTSAKEVATRIYAPLKEKIESIFANLSSKKDKKNDLSNFDPEIQNTIKTSKSILGKISPALYTRFETVLQNNKLNIIDETDEVKKEYPNRKASRANLKEQSIKLDPYYNDSDVCALLHELTHLEMPLPRFSLLAEIASDLVGFQACEILHQKGRKVTGNHDKFFNAFDVGSRLVLKILKLMDTYKETGKVSGQDIYNFCTAVPNSKHSGENEKVMSIMPFLEYKIAISDAAHFIGPTSALVLNEKIKNKEFDLQTVFDTLKDTNRSESQRLTDLGINTRTLTTAIQNYVSTHKAKNTSNTKENKPAETKPAENSQ